VEKVAPQREDWWTPTPPERRMLSGTCRGHFPSVALTSSASEKDPAGCPKWHPNIAWKWCAHYCTSRNFSAIAVFGPGGPVGVVSIGSQSKYPNIANTWGSLNFGSRFGSASFWQ
jgi:hypothetical protein